MFTAAACCSESHQLTALLSQPSILLFGRGAQMHKQISGHLQAAVAGVSGGLRQPHPRVSDQQHHHLRLWAAKPDREFDLQAFNTGDYVQARLSASVGPTLDAGCRVPSQCRPQGCKPAHMLQHQLGGLRSPDACLEMGRRWYCQGCGLALHLSCMPDAPGDATRWLSSCLPVGSDRRYIPA